MMMQGEKINKFRVALECSIRQKFALKFMVRFQCVSTRGHSLGEAPSKPPTPLLLVPWAESDQGRWRPLTIPGPKLPNSDGRISCSDGWVRRRIGRDRRPGKPWPFPGRGGRKSDSPKEPCLWPLAPPETGRRWQRCSDRELTSTTPT